MSSLEINFQELFRPNLDYTENRKAILEKDVIICWKIFPPQLIISSIENQFIEKFLQTVQLWHDNKNEPKITVLQSRSLYNKIFL